MRAHAGSTWDGSADSLRSGLEPIPGYRLIRRRGRGGFGEVWEAETAGRFLVALKFVRTVPGVVSPERRALAIAREIRHPNILPGFGSWQVGEVLIIGMELADRSVWDRFAEAVGAGLRGIPRSELLGYFADLAGALDYLNAAVHTLGGQAGMAVQHRDIKPSNLLLVGGGAKLADLGMARVMAGSRTGHTGSWTFPYAAPEFFRGETSARSDQYGLAASYCQLRSGRLPFAGNAATITAGHLFGEPDLNHLPEAEQAIVARGLAKEPDDRWPTCRSFVAALRAVTDEDAPECLDDPDGRHTRAVPAGPDGGDGHPLLLWHSFSSVDAAIGSLDTPATPATQPLAEQADRIEGRAVRPLPPRSGARRWRDLGWRSFVATLAGVALVAVGIQSPHLAARPHRSAPAIAAGSRPTAATTGAVVALPPGPDPSPLAGPSTVAAVEPPPPAPAPDLIPPAVAREPATDPVIHPAATLGVAGPTRPADAAEARRRGLDQLQRGAFGPALKELDDAVRLDPASSQGFYFRGLAHHGSCHLPEALADYSRAIGIDPRNPAIFEARGQARHDLGALNLAVLDYSEAIRLRPGAAIPRFRRGVARYRLDDFAGALDDFTAAARLDPSNDRAAEYREVARVRIARDRIRTLPGPIAAP